MTTSYERAGIEYDAQLARKLLAEWEAWKEGGGKVDPPDWPTWSGMASVILDSAIKRAERSE